MKKPTLLKKYPETQTTPKEPRSSGKTQLWQHWLQVFWEERPHPSSTRILGVFPLD